MPVTAASTLQFFWRDRSVEKRFQSGVSLHSHTMFSEESLDMIPRYTAKLPYLGRAIREQEERYSSRRGQHFDFKCAFWTPPLTPRQAYRLEEKQIQRRFQLPGFVSLTDHDDIRAAGLLRVLNQFRKAPVSIEWTVPFGPTFFHLGIHNLPADESRPLQAELAQFTANNPAADTLAGYLEKLTSRPDVLVVLNHPLWDEKGIGSALHQQALLQLLKKQGKHIHALELNGLRSWHENKDVISLARESDLPVISGGDRHGREPNAILNLTEASSFPGFIDEVRFGRRSHVVFMPQYREPIRLRVLQTMVDVVRDYPENIEGRRVWSDRVFYRDPLSLVTSPLTLIWNDGGPRVVKHFISAMRLFDWPGMRSASDCTRRPRRRLVGRGGLYSMSYARAAFLPDTFHEVNGVAHTSRQFEAFARRQQIPFLSIHCGPVTETVVDGAVTVMQLKRGPASIGLDAHLDYDPFLFRYAQKVMAELRNFGADVIHITGPGDMGTLGCYVARQLGLPLVISWHTSLHEYAGRRLEQVLSFLGPRLSRRIGSIAQKLGLRFLSWFYRRATVALAPNQELVRMVRDLTGRPVFLMKRGVNTRLFSSARRSRVTDAFRIGYVGRLTAEKNVRFLAELGNALRILGRENFEIVIVGEGREEAWLRQHTPNAVFTGVLRGERLAEVYANMDLFVFPSRTDTFGNVILEALASGVPAVVTASGGPKFLIDSGVTGFVAPTDWDFISAVNEIMSNRDLHRRMSQAALSYASLQSWDTVFEQVFRAYENCRPVASVLKSPVLGNA